jgi:Secretion system C-terminal sorting domain
VDGQFTVTLPATISLPVKMDMISAHGQNVFTRQLNSYSNSIQTKGLAKGWYIIRVSNENSIETLKLLIE